MKQKKVLVVFSGGQDSTTCLGIAKKQYKEVQTITFLYGQKHKREIEQSKKICNILNVKQTLIDCSFLGSIVNSALTSNKDVNIPHQDNKDLPASFVPNRNTLFLTLAHAFAQKIKADIIIIGACQEDYSGYPDCRDIFIKGLNKILNLGSDSEIKIETPLMFIDKAKTFQLAYDNNCLDIVLKHSHTCYNGDEKMNKWGAGCGKCPACILRKKGFEKWKKLER